MNQEAIVHALSDAQRESGLIDALHRVFGKNIHINVCFPASVHQADIGELALSQRSSNALHRAGVSTVGALIRRINEGSLTDIRNLGIRSDREIRTKLLIYGFGCLTEREKLAFFRRLAQDNTPVPPYAPTH